MNNEFTLARVNSICEEFEAELQMEGSSPSMETYLSRASESDQPTLLEYLLQLELDYRIKRGDDIALDVYLEKFDKFPSVVRRVFQSISDEPHVTEYDSAKLRSTVGTDTLEQESKSLDHGDRIGGYELLEIIGKGGMGYVYRARQLSLDRIVALKMIQAASLDSDQLRRRFFAEAEAAGKLDHPGIVAVYDIGEDQNRLYYTMALVEGSSLSKLVSDGPIEPIRAAELAIQICDAMAYAHKHGFIHRDLKPANVLLDNQGTAKVADFGLVKSIQSDSNLTMTGQIVGTPSYMPPEQALGNLDDITVRSDIYGIGSILYHMLTGKPPFQASSVIDTIFQVIHEQPIAPRELNRRIHKDIETICLKCLHKLPAKRFQSVDEVASDLRRFLDGKPIVARPIPKLEHAARWVSRNRTMSSLAAALVIAIVGGIAGIAWKWLEAVRYADIADDERAAVVESSLALQRQSSRLLFQRGQEIARDGRPADGLLWLDQSLAMSPNEPDDQHWRDIVSASLEDWWNYIPKLENRVEFPERVTAVSIAPSGDFFVVGGEQGSWQAFDTSGNAIGSIAKLNTSTGQRIQIIDIAIHPSEDWMLIASGSVNPEAADGALTKIDLKTRDEALIKKLPQIVSSVEISHDGDRVAVGGGDKKNVSLWLLETVKLEAWENKISLPHWPGASVFSPDGQGLLLASHPNDPGPAWFVDVSTRDTVEIAYDKPAFSVCYHPNGNSAVVGFADGAIQEWSLTPPKLIRSGPKQASAVEELQFSNDGTLLTLSTESNASIVLDSNTLRALDTPIRNAETLQWCNSDNHLVSAAQTGLDIWRYPRDVSLQTRSDSTLSEPRGLPHRSVALCKSRALCSIAPGIAQLFNAETGFPVGVPMHHPFENIRTTAFSPDESLCVTACQSDTTIDCQLRVWDAQTGAPITDWFQMRNWVAAVAFSPNGKWLVAGDYAATLSFWDTSNWDTPPTIANTTDIICALDFSPDSKTLAIGQAVAWSDAPHAIVWDVDSNSRIGEPLLHDDTVWSVSFNSAGDRLLCASGDGKVRIWDVESQELIGEPLDVANSTACTTFSPDGKSFLTGDDQGVVRVYSAVDGSAESQTRWSNKGESVIGLAMHEEGEHFVAAYNDGRMQLFDFTSGEPIGACRHTRTPPAAIIIDDEHWSAVEDSGRLTHVPIANPNSWHESETASVAYQLATAHSFDEQSQGVALMNRSNWRSLQERVGLSDRDHRDLRPQLDASTDALSVVRIKQELSSAWHDAHYSAALSTLASYVEVGGEDWELHAAYASALAETGELDRANSRFRQLRETLDSEEVLLDEWIRGQVTSSMLRDNNELARWYIDRLVAEVPDDWSLLRDRADILEALSDDGAAAADREKALSLNPDGDFIAKMANQRAHEFDWTGAAELYSRVAPRLDISVDERERQALSALMSDDLEMYRRVCAYALDQLDQKSPTLGEARLTVYICGFGAQNEANSKRAVNWANQLVDRWGDDEPVPKSREIVILAWLFVRCNNFEKAIELFDEAAMLGGRDTSSAKIGRMLAHAGNGELEKARTLLKEFPRQAFIDSQPDLWQESATQLYFQEIDQLLSGE